MASHGNFLSQTDFRGRNDDGDETGATWIAPVNTNWEQRPDRNFRLRLKVDADPDAINFISLFYAYNDNIIFDDVSAMDDKLQPAFSTFYDDREDTTEQLPVGNFPFVTPNEGMGNNKSSSAQIFFDNPGAVVEVEFCLKIIGTGVQDRDRFRIRGQIGSGIFYDRGYFETPEITVDVPRTIRRTIFME